ncbi:MAG: hypothetical protein JW874_02600 [Spirochaetales bacterium]|nr:hypothetical protein [Spirochaetales bacterium]
MKKTTVVFVLTLLIFIFTACEQQTGPGDTASSYTITVSVNGNNTNYVYVCWIENTSGTNIQNLKVCTNANPASDGLSGIGLPIWSRPYSAATGEGAYYEHPDDVDEVTSATVHGVFDIEQALTVPSSVRKFTILFEIDRSWNPNDYFTTDRPSFLYSTEEINLDTLDSSYECTLAGWMCNDSMSGYVSQAPNDLDEFPFFDDISDVPYNYRTELEYIADSDGNYDDMINSITVTVTPQ